MSNNSTFLYSTFFHRLPTIVQIRKSFKRNIRPGMLLWWRGPACRGLEQVSRRLAAAAASGPAGPARPEQARYIVHYVLPHKTAAGPLGGGRAPGPPVSFAWRW